MDKNGEAGTAVAEGSAEKGVEGELLLATPAPPQGGLFVIEAADTKEAEVEGGDSTLFVAATAALANGESTRV